MPEKIQGPDPEVPAKPVRRVFTAKYKQRIVDAAAQLEAEGNGTGGLLRKEGVYRSQLSDWRRAIAAKGTAGLERQKRGKKPSATSAANATAKLELRKRDRRIAQLERELERARFIVEFQKKWRR